MLVFSGWNLQAASKTVFVEPSCWTSLLVYRVVLISVYVTSYGTASLGVCISTPMATRAVDFGAQVNHAETVGWNMVKYGEILQKWNHSFSHKFGQRSLGKQSRKMQWNFWRWCFVGSSVGSVRIGNPTMFQLLSHVWIHGAPNRQKAPCFHCLLIWFLLFYSLQKGFNPSLWSSQQKSPTKRDSLHPFKPLTINWQHRLKTTKFKSKRFFKSMDGQKLPCLKHHLTQFETSSTV